MKTLLIALMISLPAQANPIKEFVIDTCLYGYLMASKDLGAPITQELFEKADTLCSDYANKTVRK